MSISDKKLNAYQKKLGKHIRKLRKQNQFSQLDLAVECDYEKTTISRIENGRTNLTIKTLLTLAHALDVELSELII